MKPITPSEVPDQKTVLIPLAIIQATNELISINYSNGYACIKQSDIIVRAKEIDSSLSNKFNYKWLNIEEIYEKVGWRVNYDKPAYNESYPATFTFRKK